MENEFDCIGYVTMGQNTSQCYVRGCKTDSTLFLHKAIGCFECKTCNRGRLTICAEHAIKLGDIYYICPKTKAIKCNYFSDRIVCGFFGSYRVVFKIQDNYIYFNDENQCFYNRYRPICPNIYELQTSDHADILADLTFDFMLDEVKKSAKNYLNVFPKDIYNIIKIYL